MQTSLRSQHAPSVVADSARDVHPCQGLGEGPHQPYDIPLLYYQGPWHASNEHTFPPCIPTRQHHSKTPLTPQPHLTTPPPPTAAAYRVSVGWLGDSGPHHTSPCNWGSFTTRLSEGLRPVLLPLCTTSAPLLAREASGSNRRA